MTEKSVSLTGLSREAALEKASSFIDDVFEIARERFEIDVLDAGAADQDEIDEMCRDHEAHCAAWKEKTLADLAKLLDASQAPDAMAFEAALACVGDKTLN